MSDEYSIYSSNGTPPPGEDVSTFQKLDADTNKDLDLFVDSLKDQRLLLTKRPPDEAGPCSLASEDGTATWFRTLDEGSAVTVTAGETTGIESFQINLTKPWNMVFSSTPVDINVAFGPPEGSDPTAPRIKAPGLAKFDSEEGGGMTLCCALDLENTDAAPQDLAVKDLVGFVAFKGKIPDAIMKLGVVFDTKQAMLKPVRNALWFDPKAESSTTIRLQFEMKGVGEMQSILRNALKDRFSLNSGVVVCKKIVTATAPDSDTEPVEKGSLAFYLDCSLNTGVNMSGAVEFHETLMGLTLEISSRDALDGITRWLGELGNIDLAKEIKELREKDGLLETLRPRRISISLDSAENPDEPTLASFALDLEVEADFLKGSDGQPVLFLLSYSWSRKDGGFGALEGKLWNDYNAETDRTLDPSYEIWKDLQPTQGEKSPADSFELRRVIPGLPVDSLPQNVPDTVNRASLVISQSEFNLGGTITAKPLDQTSVPQPQLGELTLDVAYAWGKKSEFTLALRFEASIEPPKGASEDKKPATLEGSLTYSSAPPKDEPEESEAEGEGDPEENPQGPEPEEAEKDQIVLLAEPDPAPVTPNIRTWKLSASLSQLHASYLYQFFEVGDADHVIPLIESLVLDTLSVDYTYSSKAGTKKAGAVSGTEKTVPASSFNIAGKILIDEIVLQLSFNCAKNEKENKWEIKASMGVQDADTTIGKVLGSMLGDRDLDIPPFLADMKLVKGEGDEKKEIFELTVAKSALVPPPKKDGEITVPVGNNKPGPPGATKYDFHLLAEMAIGNDPSLELTFCQFHSDSWPALSPSKRLVKAAIRGLPEIKVPLVGNITQPFDELYFFWVQDPPPKNKTPAAQPKTVVPNQAGLLRSDVTLLNAVLSDPLVPKDKYATQKDADLLITAGSHIGVIIKNSAGKRVCIIDYDFKKQQPPAKAGSVVPARGGGSTARRALPAAKAAPGAPTKTVSTDGSSVEAPLKKQVGPLSISNLGLKFVDGKLRITLDAMFELGPLAFSLLGFGIDLDIKDLSKVPDISISLEGLAAAFDKPPITIAGIIRHGKTGELDYYAGGLIVGFVPYQFTAAGFYGDAKNPDGVGSYKSIFVFAKLEGPLITLEFATISGVTGGIGYNSSVRVPEAGEISEFPFVKTDSVGSAGDALKALERLTSPESGGWFQPKLDTFWIAAGMKVDAFEMLAIDAVVVVQLGRSTKLGIFAVGTGDIPTKKSPFKIAHIELGLAVSVDFDYGVLKVEAQLQPNSYILHPDCHLTGGFGLYYWFPAPHADDTLTGGFVFTLGGYHQAFQVPVGYPNPPRLGISWSLGSNLSIRGEAYFTITPKVCMAGGRLHAQFEAGPLSAWFDAFANFLINFRPFYFTADAGVSIGVRISIDIWFIHTEISAEIGAQLYLWGPPVAGRVHVNFWVMGFDINFGDSPRSPKPANLEEFYQLVLTSSAKAKAPPVAAAAALPAPDGDENSPSPGASAAIVAANVKTDGHLFMCEDGMVNHSSDPNKDTNAPWTVRGGLFACVVACKMAIRTAVVNAGPPVVYEENPIYAKPMQLPTPLDSNMTVTIESVKSGSSEVMKIEDGWGVEQHIKPAPEGLWKLYNKNDDMLDNGPGTVPLMMGIRLTAPPPILSKDPFPAYKIEDATLVRIKSAKRFPKPAGATAAFGPAPAITGETQAEKAKQWTAVYDTWVAASDAQAQKVKESAKPGFVDKWAETLGWDASVLKGLGRMPRRLRNQKVFDNYYVAAPLISQG